MRKNQTFQTNHRTPLVLKHDDLTLEKSIARAPQEIDYRCTKCTAVIKSVENILAHLPKSHVRICNGNISSIYSKTEFVFTLELEYYFSVTNITAYILAR